ncbi:RNA polymerase sigma factor [Mucilaginibacter antarcticus]|uniref:RNA polymerase sigma factor n=1 Tax=Mucilaginibacter antarcticus TaxID=1855725 RepID=A0ABW5XKI5_9SPHI
MEQPDDLYYLAKINNGSQAAFAFLVDKYKDMVYSIAIKILRDTDEAQDIAQDSFIKAYQQIGAFQGRSKFSTWLYTITYRTAITRLKQNKVEIVTLGDDIDAIADHLPGQIDLLQSKQVKHYVKMAIDKLPQIDALLVTLYYINDLPIKEIEEITGLSKPNIKIKLFRARKVLESDLKFLMDNEQGANNESK